MGYQSNLEAVPQLEIKVKSVSGGTSSYLLGETIDK